MIEHDANWYALQVRPNYEHAVAGWLDDLGIERYLPLNRSIRHQKRSRSAEGVPLFPGYLFPHLNLDSGPRLYGIPGVIRILGHGGQAVPIEHSEITMIRSMADSPLRVELIPYFQLGTKILLTAGPLCGVAGTFLSSAKGNKLVVSLPLLNRSLAVTVLSEWVSAEPASRNPSEVFAW
jgi:transcription antitermination factor NusG